MKTFGYSLIGVAVLASFAGCDRVASVGPAEKTAAKAEPAAEIIIPVQVEKPIRGNISSHFETTSRVEAEKKVQVVAEAIGQCEQVFVEEGDTVRAGQVLAELDKTEALATIGQTEVQVRQTHTAYERAKEAADMGIGPPMERDNAKFAYDQAMATLNMHKVQLDKLTIRAPISGVVTKRNVVRGQLVANGVMLFQIVAPESFILTINPPERELARLKLGQIAKVTIDALGNEQFDAVVQRINPGIDPTYGTVKVVLEFAPDVRKLLRESAFARVRLVMDTHENALLVPKDALVEENARKYLFVVEEDVTAPAESRQDAAAGLSPDTVAAQSASSSEAEGRKYLAKRVEVDTGLEDSNYVEILGGLSDDDQVVTLGQHTLKPGSRVTVTRVDEEIRANLAINAEEALKKAKERSANDAADSKIRAGRRRHP